MGHVFSKYLKITTTVILLALASCKGEQSGDPIVIPPGQLIEYSNSQFITYSKTYYTMELMRFDKVSKKFFSVSDLTPSENKDLSQDRRFVVPKTENVGGTYIVRASLPVQGIALNAFVTSTGVVYPGIAASLVVDLVTNYPGFAVDSITDDTVITLTAEAEKAIERAKSEFQLTGNEYSLKIWYRFLQNYLARDPDFLDLANKKSFSFEVASSGMVEEEPYPFGKKNTVPILDAGNSTPNTSTVQARENTELTLKGRATDVEADEVLYGWYVGDKLSSRDPLIFKWTPGFQDSRDDLYQVTLKISDGGIPRVITWDIKVLDYNRAPEIFAECPAKVREGQEWFCKVSTIDYDGDPVKFTISDKSTNARLTIDGAKTDDTTRQLSVTNKNEIELRLSPNNTDAKKRSAYIEVSVDDGKSGTATKPLNFLVEDINSPPEITPVNGDVIQTMIPGTVAHEWDYCADEDPDGVGAYRFMIEVRDPDNQPSVAPRNAIPDVVSVSFGGSLKEALSEVTEAMGCPASNSERSYFCFEWKPHHSPKSGTLTLVLKDDHGGIVQIPSPELPTPIILTAEDRNVRPCMTAKSLTRVLSDNTSVVSDDFGGQDEDETSPWPELVNVPDPAIPLLASKESGAKMLVFHRTIYSPNDWVVRFPNAGVGPSLASYDIWLKRPFSGFVKFTRNSGYSSDIAITEGTRLRTSTVTPKIEYEVAQTVTMAKEDLGVTVPVRAVNRDVAVGKLNRFTGSFPAFTVTNETTLSKSGIAKISRSVTTAAATLPAGTELSTSEIADGSDTIRYETVDNVRFNIGVGSMNVRVRRKLVTAAANTVNVVVSATWPGPILTVTNSIPLWDVLEYSLVHDLTKGETEGLDKFCCNRRVSDSGVVNNAAPLSPFSFTAPLGMTFKASGSIEVMGDIAILRSSSGAAYTLPMGSVLRAADGTRFSTLSSVTLNAGITSSTVSAARVNNYNPTPATPAPVCIGWSDTNYEPAFLNASSVKVNEGGGISDFEMNVTDNRVDPTQPNDILDRHTFTVEAIGTPPLGSFKICRQPGDNPANIDSPACVPCDSTSGTYFETASCYFRFKPDIEDVSQVFSFNVTVDDHGLNFPLGTNVRSQSINVAVIENNNAPKHVSSAGVPLTNNIIDNNVYLGEFVEGLESRYRMYFTDEDKGTELKTMVAPKMLRTWQFFSPTGWVLSAKNPSGLILELQSASVMNPSGWGSTTTGQVRWKPNDEDAKRFAGSSGFVLEISQCDMGTADSPQQCSTGFYRMTTRNINNLPSVSASTSISTINVQADLYQTKNFNVIDPDNASNSVMTNTQSSFVTRLSMCSTPGVYDCEADRTGWPMALSSYESPYAGNTAVASCQSGGVLTVNKFPQFVLTNVTGSVDATTRIYPYQFRWCPQKSHIGNHIVYFNLTDNGDEDIRGPTSKLAVQKVQVPVKLNVVAPVFFESPKKSISSIDAVSWMKQAFSLTEYRYEILINNSRGNALNLELLQRAKITAGTVGDPYLEVRNYSSPTVVAGTSTTILSNINPKNQRIFLVWKPYGATNITPYVSSATDQSTWPLFQLKVTDRATAENETVQFRVRVKDSLNPPNVAPVIDSYFPAMTALSVKEQVPQTFSVTASDANGDPITYRWYLDGKFVSDAGPSYAFLPKMDDAFLPASSPGKHSLMVQLLDGQERATPPSYTWTVVVRNTVPSPLRMTYANSALTPWTFSQSVIERGGLSGAISNLSWGPTVAVATTSGATSNNHLLFTGTYTRGSVTRNFVWRLQFANASFTDTDPNSGAQGSEILPWVVGRKSEQISFTQDTGNLKSVLVSSNKDPEGVFSSTSDAVTLAPTLTSISSLTAANACTGACSQNFFQNFASQISPAPAPGYISSSGTQPAAAYADGSAVYYFFSSLEGAVLKWSRAGSSASLMAAMTGNDRIGDIAVNPVTQRLYVTVRDPAALRNFIYVYDIHSISAGSFNFVTALSVNDGVNPDNRILDLAIDRNKNRVYALLPGTGGVVSFVDDGLSVPTVADLQFIGVNEISSSYTDEVGAGRKLVFNSTSELLYGISKDANEVFIIDTQSNAFSTKVFRTDVTVDDILTYGNDGLTVAVSRALGWIYLIR